MRLTQLVLAIALVAGLLAVVWFAVRTEPAQAKELPEIAAPSAEDPRRLDALDAQGGSAETPERAGSERALLAGAAAEAPAAPATDLRASASDVTGRVVDRDGNGVAGADVYASNGLDWIAIPLDVEPEGTPKGWIEIERATTDAAGRFAIAGLKPGALRLAVRASGYAPRAIEDAFVPDDPPRVLPDIVLDPGVVLSGRVVDSGGNGVRGALLLAALDGSDSKQTVAVPGRGVPVGTTGENGEFRIDRLAAGPWRLIVDSPAHVVADARGETLAAGEEQSGIVIRLEAGSVIEGTIQWSRAGAPGGAGASGSGEEFELVRVSARPSTEAAAGEVAPARTIDPVQTRARHAIVDSSGRFELRGLIAGIRYRLTAAHPLPEGAGWKSISALEPVLAFAGERGVVLAQRPSTALSFRVVDDASGAPLEQLTVSAGVGRERLLRDDDGEARIAFPDGRVRVPDLRAQASGKPIQLRVCANGYRDFERRDVSFTPGVDLDLGEIRLAREHALVVTVVDDHTGAPIEDARVIAGTIEPNEIADYLASPIESSFHGAPKLRFGRTGADGRVHLSSYPGLSIHVCADARGYRASSPRVELCPPDGDHAVELRLARGGVVIVRVLDPSGQPIARMGVAHLEPGASPSATSRLRFPCVRRRAGG